MSLHKSFLWDPLNSFWHVPVLLPSWGVVDFTMIKGLLSSLITQLCESLWSSHCIASKRGLDVALWKSLLCRMNCLTSHDIL